jgi:hypothetical protein
LYRSNKTLDKAQLLDDPFELRLWCCFPSSSLHSR